MATLPDPPESAWPVRTVLLQRRMIALNLDIGALAQIEPGIVGDLQGRCMTCRGAERCAEDFLAHSDDPAWPDWRDYCPNAARLEMLVALQYF